jgi:hypothetical protein
MDLQLEEFDQKFKEALDQAILLLAEDPDIGLDKFWGLSCFLENLSHFSPVLYGVLANAKKY